MILSYKEALNKDLSTSQFISVIYTIFSFSIPACLGGEIAWRAKRMSLWDERTTVFNVLVRNLFSSFLQRPEKALDVLKEHQVLFLT